ncbi:MAG: hypothetical protein ACRDXX_11580 [Stackebrandtia sp.]
MRDLNLVEYRHPDAGFTLALPVGWELRENPQPNVSLIVFEPETSDGFRANAVVTVEELPEELDLESWQHSSDELLEHAFGEYILIDREHIEVDGQSVVRRLAHHAGEDTGSVTMEQWATVDGDKGYTFTTSVSTMAYDSHADLFSEMAQQFRVDDSSEVA